MEFYNAKIIFDTCIIYVSDILVFTLKETIWKVLTRQRVTFTMDILINTMPSKDILSEVSVLLDVFTNMSSHNAANVNRF